ncbi:hypothetical protein NDU88_006510 [Pleurodeles waltl]|uniref:Uncharacterized protein n=1 Tax=Pleurodeles waltl TaxID=8319 RepID=A0AAV7NS53_PLEWA|nr:hypothetical protein NDU88_006510 [Pleurodeles waltl]
MSPLRLRQQHPRRRSLGNFRPAPWIRRVGPRLDDLACGSGGPLGQENWSQATKPEAWPTRGGGGSGRASPACCAAEKMATDGPAAWCVEGPRGSNRADPSLCSLGGDQAPAARRNKRTVRSPGPPY